MNLPQNIQIARVRAGLTQEALAERLGIATSQVGQYETGYRTPRLARLEEIAKACKTTVSELTKR
jgi:transcriptional regulator with XRE-family HTH domain